MQKTILVLFILLLAAFAAASAPTNNSQAASNAAAIRTYMLPDFRLVTVITFDAAGAASSPVQALGAASRPKRGFCRCSCGFPCATSADCGGASCDPFITCCAKDPQGNEWFNALTQASRKYPVPEALLKANCK